MFQPTYIADIELSQPLTAVTKLSGYGQVKGIMRWHGIPVDCLDLPVIVDECPVTAIHEAMINAFPSALAYTLLQQQLATGITADTNLWHPSATPQKRLTPLVTVAVCTRDRTDDLRLCLDALQQLDYHPLEILVVDNAPTNEATAQLIQHHYPTVRYICEPRPGLDWARNCAITHARGEIIAYTDDDVIVDAGWVTALVYPFIVDESVMAVTGLVLPYELETEAQHLFETYGGFSRGCRRQWHRVNPWGGREWEYRGTGRFGTGANMAYRRQLFTQIGPFDPALDVGTVTNGGGDLEMFFRVLKEGYTLVYEPAALVRHRHRRTYKKLHAQITNNGVGLFAFWVRAALAYAEERRNLWRIGIWWVAWWYLRRLLLFYLRPDPLPGALIWTEIRGAWAGLRRYQQARRHAVALAAQTGITLPNRPKRPLQTRPTNVKIGNETAVVFVDISQPLTPITDIETYPQVNITITMHQQLLGTISIYNCYRPISVPHLVDVIVDQLAAPLLDKGRGRNQMMVWADWQQQIIQHFNIQPPPPLTLPATIPVSIVLATYDRPEGLERCLNLLRNVATTRPLQIIVVDNHPASGLTPPVIAKFPTIQLVSEPRQGLAYARNAGIRASQGDIIVMTDDDVIFPPDWLEKLVAPFARQDVMAVTGNVLPAELETGAQHLFEMYGGLGRGFERKVVDGAWFEKFRLRAVPTWELGATANAAFRATIFADPAIGFMDEALGPGLPSGVGEDTYLFYKVLKAGHTLIYEPSAYVQHTHRRTDKALRRQLYNYSKGHVAYHLTTWWRDGDWRAWFQLWVWLPIGLLWRLLAHFSGRGYYPVRLLLVEVWGNLVGPLALLHSWGRVWWQRRQDET